MSSAVTTEIRRSPAAHEELALFHRTLAELCRAQVPLPRSLTLLRDQLRAGPLRDATDAMLRDVEAGVPLDAVQDTLGHESIETTPRYAHRQNEAKLRAMNAVDSVIRGAKSPAAKQAKRN